LCLCFVALVVAFGRAGRSVVVVGSCGLSVLGVAGLLFVGALGGRWSLPGLMGPGSSRPSAPIIFVLSAIRAVGAVLSAMVGLTVVAMLGKLHLTESAHTSSRGPLPAPPPPGQIRQEVNRWRLS